MSFHNNVIQTPQPKFVRITARFALVALIILIVGVGAMLYVVVQASGWAYQNYVQWRGNNADSALITSPLSKVKEYFSRSNQEKSVEKIRVVSEESQVIEVVKKTAPAVVSIIASEEVPKLEQCYRDSLEGVPFEFNELFPIRIPALCQNGTQVVRVGAGTGFVVSPDGFIITNKHVVQKEKAEYTVVLNDKANWGKKVKAKVVARDPNNDLAVLKIDMKGVPHLSFGNSDSLQVGQTAIAIGYALGQFDNTVSKGVVSGLYRSISAVGGGGVEHLRGLIQTDAAINPGNSGGPLLDIEGNVIGVNVATAEAQSIGFAIPSNMARRAFEEVKTTGQITAKKRAFIGVRYQPVTEGIKMERNVPYDYGMLVVRGANANEPAIIPDSPAEKAGLKEGDVILEANGIQLNERYWLSDFITGHEAGDEIELKVYRDGKTFSVKIKLEAMADQ